MVIGTSPNSVIAGEGAVLKSHSKQCKLLLIHSIDGAHRQTSYPPFSQILPTILNLKYGK